MDGKKEENPRCSRCCCLASKLIHLVCLPLNLVISLWKHLSNHAAQDPILEGQKLGLNTNTACDGSGNSPLIRLQEQKSPGTSEKFRSKVFDWTIEEKKKSRKKMMIKMKMIERIERGHHHPFLDQRNSQFPVGGLCLTWQNLTKGSGQPHLVPVQLFTPIL